MADDFTLNTPGGVETFRADDLGGVLAEVIKLGFGVPGAAQMVDAAHPLPVYTPTDTGATASFPGGYDQTDADHTIIAPRADRQMVVICNPSTFPIWLGFGATAVVDEGFFVPPGGQFPLTGWVDSIHAIHADTGVLHRVTWVEFA